jgi:hypothetical protein
MSLPVDEIEEMHDAFCQLEDVRRSETPSANSKFFPFDCFLSRAAARSAHVNPPFPPPRLRAPLTSGVCLTRAPDRAPASSPPYCRARARRLVRFGGLFVRHSTCRRRAAGAGTRAHRRASSERAGAARRATDAGRRSRAAPPAPLRPPTHVGHRSDDGGRQTAARCAGGGPKRKAGVGCLAGAPRGRGNNSAVQVGGYRPGLR